MVTGQATRYLIAAVLLIAAMAITRRGPGSGRPGAT